jgi:hypothetical protein
MRAVPYRYVQVRSCAGFWGERDRMPMDLGPGIPYSSHRCTAIYFVVDKDIGISFARTSSLDAARAAVRVLECGYYPPGMFSVLGPAWYKYTTQRIRILLFVLLL